MSSKTDTDIVLRGPFWTQYDATRELGCSTECLLGRRDVLRIGARLSEEVYPAYQFEDHRVRGDIATITELMLRYDVTGAVISDWLVRQNLDLGGATPLDWLNHRRPVRPVVDSARHSIPELQAVTAELRSHNLPYEGHYGPS